MDGTPSSVALVTSRLKKKRMSIVARGAREQQRRCIVSPSVIMDVDHVSHDDDFEDLTGRAQELDGGFFEGFVHLSNHQDDKVKEAEREPSKFDLGTGGTEQVLSRLFRIPPKPKARQLHAELVYTVFFQIGKKSPRSGDDVTNGELYAYGREVLGITNEEHKQIFDEVKVHKTPESFLNVAVISGHDLEAKDASGLSDPYCMLCLINRNEGVKSRKGGRGHKKLTLREFREEKDVKYTTVKKATLNPEWNQQFKFLVTDVQEQTLRIDLWDKDDSSVMIDADNQITAIRGFKGVGRFFKEVYQSARSGSENLDDFMGIVEVPLETIPLHGINAWYQLEHRKPDKKIIGKLRLRLSLSAKVKSKSVSLAQLESYVQERDPTSFKASSEALAVYEDLLRLFAAYDCYQAVQAEGQMEWSGELNENPKLILAQYAMQHELTNIELTVANWKVFSRLNEKVQIPFEKLSALLDSYKEQSSNENLESEKDVEAFADSLNSFVNCSLEMLGKYRYVFPSHSPEKIKRLAQLLSCLVQVYNLRVFCGRYSDRRLSKDIQTVIEESTKHWFKLTQAFNEPQEHSPDAVLRSLVNLTNAMNADLNKGEKGYKDLFACLHVAYTPTVFRTIEQLISATVAEQSRVIGKNLGYGLENEEQGLALFELYLAVRDLYRFKQSMKREDRVEGGVDNYSDWFRSSLIKWLDLARLRAIKRIDRALELDEVRVIDSMVRHSTSAVDVTCCLGQICAFWKRLEWPDPTSAFPLLAKIVEIVGECGNHYASAILKELVRKGFYDDVGRFDVTDQLCIMMNNLAHVEQFLDFVPEALEYDKMLARVIQNGGDGEVNRLKSTFADVIQVHKDAMVKNLRDIIVHVGGRMKTSLLDYLLKIVNHPAKEDITTVIDPMMEYIDSNLVTLNTALLAQVFDRVLYHFWETVVNCIHGFISKLGKKMTQQQYCRLFDTLEVAKNFFYGDGDGLPIDKLLTDDYQALSSLLTVYKASTTEVIEKFYVDRCEEQAQASMKYGTLTFKIFYDNVQRALNIYVMNCKSLLALDSDGSSDPYVTLSLKPDHLFPNIKSKKTEVQKHTLFPLFDTAFQFKIDPPSCLKNGATLVFTILDRDKVADDDIAGEVYFDLQNVPGLDAESVNGAFATAAQIEMPLIQGHSETLSLLVLSERAASDPLAAKFISKQRERIQKMKGGEGPKSKSWLGAILS